MKPSWVGQSRHICQETHQDPFEFIFDFLIQENGRVQILAAMIDQNDLDTIIAHPDAMIGSDGMNLSTVGVLSAGHPHPRTFGTHGHVLADYVRTRKIITLEDAVKKMTSKPAQRMRLERRGTLQEGNYADVTVLILTPSRTRPPIQNRNSTHKVSAR